MRRNIAIQISFWVLLYFFWIMVFQKREFAFTQTVTVEFCYLFFVAANYYLNILYNVPRFLYKRKYLSFISVFVLGILITALLRVPLAQVLNQNFFLKNQVQPNAKTIFTSSSLNIFMWTVIIVSAKLMIDRFRFQQYIEEVNIQKEQAELDFLNAQFNPHFLFNSINSIYGHIDKQNATARNMLLTFSDMLRYQLYECNNNNIPIEKEIDYIRNYIELQKVRKEEGLRIDFCVDQTVKNISVAPLLFIAYIENSFKYVGKNSDNESLISISFKKDNGNLLFRCYNSKGNSKLNSIEHRGIGISNAKRRLSLLYPQRNVLEIRDEKNAFEVNLAIQIA
ncbi:MAG: sensor histidine kinase [Chitinophagales bacterium]